MMKVEQMINDRGNGAMNQFVLTDGNKILFQSYSSPIAEVDKSTMVVTIYPDWDYSVTTNKHRNIFFRDYAPYPLHDLDSKKEMLKAIENGEHNAYKIVKSWEA